MKFNTGLPLWVVGVALPAMASPVQLGSLTHAPYPGDCGAVIQRIVGRNGRATVAFQLVTAKRGAIGCAPYPSRRFPAYPIEGKPEYDVEMISLSIPIPPDRLPGDISWLDWFRAGQRPNRSRTAGRREGTGNAIDLLEMAPFEGGSSDSPATLLLPLPSLPDPAGDITQWPPDGIGELARQARGAGMSAGDSSGAGTISTQPDPSQPDASQADGGNSTVRSPSPGVQFDSFRALASPRGLSQVRDALELPVERPERLALAGAPPVPLNAEGSLPAEFPLPGEYIATMGDQLPSHPPAIAERYYSAGLELPAGVNPPSGSMTALQWGGFAANHPVFAGGHVAPGIPLDEAIGGPEPSDWILVASGLLLLLAGRRPRARR